MIGVVLILVRLPVTEINPAIFFSLNGIEMNGMDTNNLSSIVSLRSVESSRAIRLSLTTVFCLFCTVLCRKKIEKNEIMLCPNEIEMYIELHIYLHFMNMFSFESLPPLAFKYRMFDQFLRPNNKCSHLLLLLMVVLAVN